MATRIIIQPGDRFNRLVAISPVPNSIKWIFQCDCGTKKPINKYHVSQSVVRSCGCIRKERCAKTALDITGIKFGRLRAIRRIGTDKNRKAIWLFQCDCGGIADTLATRVQSGHTKSCGCLRRDMLKYMQSHGKHYGSHTREWKSWRSMKERCLNPNSPAWHNYGERGITICDRWLGPDGAKNFLNDMGSCPHKYTLERKRNNEGYSPANCTWSSRKEQARNTRVNFNITYNGETKVAIAWAEQLGINPSTLISRIKKSKWSVEKAFTTPVSLSSIQRKKPVVNIPIIGQLDLFEKS